MKHNILTVGDLKRYLQDVDDNVTIAFSLYDEPGISLEVCEGDEVVMFIDEPDYHTYSIVSNEELNEEGVVYSLGRYLEKF